MLIFFIGLPGTGKSTLSQGVAAALQINRYELDELKRELYPALEPDFQYKLDNNIPFSEEANLRFYSKAAEALAAAASDHDHLVIDEMLNRNAYRKILYEVADEYFGGHVIVWINTPDAIIRQRLAAFEREGHLLQDPIGTYEVFRGRFDDPEDADIVVTNEGTYQDTLDLLIPIIKEKLPK